jgi:O-acetyl-ADP-ribose deacetylase (regulator of RNase III)
VQEVIAGIVEGRARRLEPVQVFLWYTHADAGFIEDFRKHLAPLVREGLISEWYDRMIQAGADWREEIESHLQQAQIILLFSSPSFIASDHASSTEVQRAMERQAARDARVIPILLQPADYRLAPYSMLQYLPKNGLPVAQWRNRNAAFVAIVSELETVFEEVQRAGREGRPDNARSPWQVSARTRKLFLFSAESDEDALSRLEAHLASFRDGGSLDDWHRRKIKPGAIIGQEIESHIFEADEIILLVSRAYLASEQCDREMLLALQRQRDGSARVLPVLLETCEWQETALRILPLWPVPPPPLSAWEDQDEAYVLLVREIIQETTLTGTAGKPGQGEQQKDAEPDAQRADLLQVYRQRARPSPALSSSSLSPAEQAAFAHIYILQGDVLELPVDALIHSVGGALYNRGMLGEDISLRGGPDLERQLSSLRHLEPFETVVTDAGNLPVRLLIHVSNENNEGWLDETMLGVIEAALNRAESMREIRTLALTSIGSRNAGVAPEQVAPGILQAMARYLTTSSHVQEVFFVLDTLHTYEAYQEAYRNLVAASSPDRAVYALVLHASQPEAKVGEKVLVDVTLLLVPEGEQADTFALPAGLETIYCFLAASDQGLCLPGPDIKAIHMQGSDGVRPTAQFALQARLPGLRAYTVEMRRERAEEQVEIIPQARGTVLVTEPQHGEAIPSPLLPLDIHVTFQPSCVFQVTCSWPAGMDGPSQLHDRLTTHLAGKHVRNEAVGKILLQQSQLRRFRDLLHETVRQASNLQPADMRARLLMAGTYLFTLLFPRSEECRSFHTLFWEIEKHIKSFLIVEDGVIGLPWDLLAPCRDIGS